MPPTSKATATAPVARRLLAATVALGTLAAGLLSPVAAGASTTLSDPMRGLGRAEGYGAPVTGGAAGPTEVVTTLADRGPGSLRAAAESPGARWITFGVSGEIRLLTPLKVAADKTIDGRGAAINIRDHGLVVVGANVIVTHLTVGPLQPSVTEDAILVKGTSGVWINHNALTGAGDKLIGMPGGVTAATVSWNWFHDQVQVFQIGTYATRAVDGRSRVTVHHNLFERVGYRNPRVSYGRVHVYNNLVRAWATHGMSSVRGAQLLSEANIFEAGEDKNAVLTTGAADEKDDVPGYVLSRGDASLNGAIILQNRPELVGGSPYPATIEVADAGLRARLLAGAGAGPRMETAPPVSWSVTAARRAPLRRR